MAELNEGKHTGEFILAEAPGTISRDTVTVTVGAATKLAPGTVLGKLSGTGLYVPYDDSASDGSENAAGILYGELDNSEGIAPADITGVVIDAIAEVREDDLVWGDGVDEAAGLADLLALNIKARD
jgi:Na+-transporting NADH:ubiquinone oxidoreductase subunit NqrA